MQEKKKKKKILAILIVVVIAIILSLTITNLMKQKKLSKEIEILKGFGQTYNFYIKNVSSYIEENIYTTPIGTKVNPSSFTYLRIIDEEIIEQYTDAILSLIKGVKQCNEDLDKYEEIKEEIQKIKEEYITELKVFGINEKNLNDILNIKSGIYSEEVKKQLEEYIKSYLKLVHFTMHKQ